MSETGGFRTGQDTYDGKKIGLGHSKIKWQLHVCVQNKTNEKKETSMKTYTDLV